MPLVSQCILRVAVPALARLPGLVRARRGTTTLEFALVAGPLFLLILGTVEVAWQVATALALDNAALEASRFAITGAATVSGATGAPACRSASIPWLVSNASGGFISASRLTVTMSSYDNYANAAAGRSGSAGAGQGNQIVVYSLSYQQPSLTGALIFPLTGTDSLTHTTSIVVKNEPFTNATC